MLDMEGRAVKLVADSQSKLTDAFIEDNRDEFDAGRLFLSTESSGNIYAVTSPDACLTSSKLIQGDVSERDGLIASCDPKRLGFTSEIAREVVNTMRARAITEATIAESTGVQPVDGYTHRDAVRTLLEIDAAAFTRDNSRGASDEVAIEGDYNSSLRGATFEIMENGSLNHLCEVTPYDYQGESGLIFSIPYGSDIDSLYPEVRNGLDELTYRGADLSSAALVVPFDGSAYLINEPWDGHSQKPELEIHGLEQAAPFMDYARDMLNNSSQIPSAGKSISLNDEQRNAARDSLDIARGEIAASKQARLHTGLTQEQWSDGNFLNQVVLYSEAVNHEVAAQGVLDKLAQDQSSSHSLIRSSLEMEVANAQRVKESIAKENPDVVDVVSQHLSDEDKLVDTEWIDKVGKNNGRVSAKGMVEGGWLGAVKNRLEQVVSFIPNIPNYFKEFNAQNPTWQDKAGALMIGASNAFATGVTKVFDVALNAGEKMIDATGKMRDTYSRYRDIHAENEERFNRAPKEVDFASEDFAPEETLVTAEIVGIEDVPREKVAQLEAPSDEPIEVSFEAH